MANIETSTDICICCGEKPVTWPRVCEDYIDHEAQAYLASFYPDEDHTCRTCGMVYDDGMRCTYCGDSNPLDDPELDEEEW